MQSGAQVCLMKYTKQREDTFLRATFISAVNIPSEVDGSQLEWYVQFDGQECSDPAPIVSRINHENNTQNSIDSHTRDLQLRPIVSTVVCQATSHGPLKPGQHTVSLHFRPRSTSNNSKWPTSKLLTLRASSMFIVEENSNDLNSF